MKCQVLFSKEIWLHFSIFEFIPYLKYQVLFSLKNNEKVFINVVCCSCDWGFKG